MYFWTLILDQPTWLRLNTSPWWNVSITWHDHMTTGGGGGQGAYVGSYTTVVFYIRGLLLCKWHTVPTCSRIPSSKFENSNILDHVHSILKHLYCWLWTCWTPNFFRDGILLNVSSNLKKNEAKRIRNDEVIKHLVYLVSVIDRVLNDYPITTE